MKHKITLTLICILFAFNSIFSQETNFSGLASLTHNITLDDAQPNTYIKFWNGATAYNNSGEFGTFTALLDVNGVPYMTYNAPAGSNFDAVAFSYFNASDDAFIGNSALVVRTGDAVSPIITLNNPGTQSFNEGVAYQELGATATDQVDANHADDLTSNIVINLNGLDINTPGSYTILYNVSDFSGNPASQVSRQVIVLDTTKPVITNVIMSSNNTNPIYAKAGEVITLSFTSDETINTPTVMIASQSATVSHTGNNWTATLTVSNIYLQGAATFSISNITDIANNSASDISTLSSGSAIVIDTVAPIAISQNLTLASDANGAVTVTALDIDNGSSDLNGVTLSINKTDFSCRGFSFSIGAQLLTVADPAGNIATAPYTVTVTDTTKPVLILNVASSIDIEVGGFYFQSFGAVSISDNCDTTNLILGGVGTVNTNIVGSYPITYDYTDAAGNAADQVVRYINVVDTTKPVITLVGADTQTIEVHSDYATQELGATANDNYDGDISSNIVIDATNLNTAIVGSYIVTYNVADANTNNATEVTRTINVVDTTKPIITLTGVNPQVIEYNELYSELGATATDNYDDDTDLTGTIVIDATNVVEGVLGTYIVTYNVTDANGNVADQVERTVNVVDTTKPILTLTGDNPQIIEIINGDDAIYVELGATASDEYDVNVDDTDIIINTSALMLDTVGCYPVTYTVTDASGNTSVKTRIVFVLEEGKPWAKDNSFTVNQDSSNNIFNVLGNDSYGTDGANGTHPISLSGTYTDNGGKLDLVGTNVQYTPRAGFSGVDYFSYTITDENGDGSGDASTANVTITVSLNSLPTALDDAIIVAENSGVSSINVIANDNFGADGSHPTEALTVSALSAEGGTTVVNSNTGEIAYTPAANFTGLDSFTYTIKDTDGDESTATVLVTVTIVDVATPTLRPTALPDAATVSQNSGATSINVLGNDSFGTQGAIDDGLSLTDGTYMGASDKGGIISVDKKGTLTTLDDEILYTPKAGFIGEDGFKYTITDTSGDTSITTVLVTVTQIAMPTAVADAISVQQDSNLTSIDVLANDSFGSDGPAITGSLVVSSGTSSQGGTIVVVDNKINYTPAVGYIGTDNFQYTITDTTSESSSAMVTVTVTAANAVGVPTAQDDAVTVTQNSVDNLISILNDNGSGADDYGLDGANATHPISLSAFFTDNGGKLELNGDVVKYTPRTGFTGIDNFKYTLTDLNGDGDTATVTITVAALPVVLTAVDDTVTVGQDSGATNIQVLVNDILVAVTSITAFDVASVHGGFVSIGDNGTLTDATDDFLMYTPALGYIGIDTFTYTISDGVHSSTATVTVTIENAVVLPGVLAAKADAISVFQNSTANEMNVLGDNGSGVDNYGASGPKDGGLTLVNGMTTGLTEQGSVTIDDKGTLSPLDDGIVYTPNTGYVGVDHFYYMITAVDGNTAIAQVTVSIAQVAIPTAIADAVTVLEDSSANSIDVLANDSFGSDGPAVAPSIILASSLSVEGGTIVVNAEKVDYTPLAGFVGTDSFNYTIQDLSGDISTAATVTVTVSSTTVGNSNVPTAKDDIVSVIRNSVDNVINILNDNGSGVDSYGTDGPNATHPISLSATFTDIGSKLTLDGNSVKYTPKTNFTGTDTFGYTITDANGDASSAIVTINIAAPKSSSETTSAIEEVMQVYPNPSKGDFNIAVFSNTGDQVSILLFDVTGKVVYKEQLELSTGKNIIDLNLSVKAGVLFLKVYSEDNNYGTKKIVIK